VPSQRIIKKYPNRRLYDTETSTYITLVEVKQLVLDYRAFQVVDAKSGEDLTRAILLQIILEEESGGLPLFSADMLANIIRYYGHSMQGLMGAYLERSIQAFHEAQRRFQDQTQNLYGDLAAPQVAMKDIIKASQTAMPGVMGDYLEKSAQAVIGMQEELSRQAMKLFAGFPYAPADADANADDAAAPTVKHESPPVEDVAPTRVARKSSRKKSN
jgi:polyhydroxyalkanoate synthesis repressor PhaR